MRELPIRQLFASRVSETTYFSLRGGGGRKVTERAKEEEKNRIYLSVCYLGSDGKTVTTHRYCPTLREGRSSRRTPTKEEGGEERRALSGRRVE